MKVPTVEGAEEKEGVGEEWLVTSLELGVDELNKIEVLRAAIYEQLIKQVLIILMGIKYIRE